MVKEFNIIISLIKIIIFVQFLYTVFLSYFTSLLKSSSSINTFNSSLDLLLK